MKNDLRTYCDIELQELTASGHQLGDEAFKIIYDRHSNSIFNHCMYLAPKNEIAEDIFQQTWQKYYEILSGGRVIEKVGAFLYTISTNLTRNLVKKRSREILLNTNDNEYIINNIDYSSSVDNEMDKQELYELLIRAIDLLDEKDREVIVMKKLDGLKYREIAEIYGLSLEGAKKRVLRAMGRLLNILEPYLEDLSRNSAR